MYRVFEALDELGAIVEEARGVPMTAGCVVPRGDVLELIDDIKDAIPGELDDAQDVLDARDGMLRDAKAHAASFGASAEVNYIRRYPVLNNTPAHTDFCKQLVRDWLGEDGLVVNPEPITASEDFAFFLEKCKGSSCRWATAWARVRGRAAAWCTTRVTTSTTPTWPLALHTGRCWRGVIWFERWTAPLWKRSRAFW